MKHFWQILLLASAFPATAGDTTYVYVIRTSTLHTSTGPATLFRNGDHITGKLSRIKEDLIFDGQINGGIVNATVRAESSNDHVVELSGTINQRLAADGTCQETIQLANGRDALNLARNIPRCEP